MATDARAAELRAPAPAVPLSSAADAAAQGGLAHDAADFNLHIGGEQVKDGWKILNAQPKAGVDFVRAACSACVNAAHLTA